METSFQLHVNPKSDTINEALEIDPEREEILLQIVIDEVEDETDSSEALKEIVSHCKSDNEVAFSIYMYGHFTGHMCEREHGESMEALIAKFKRHKPSDN